MADYIKRFEVLKVRSGQTTLDTKALEKIAKRRRSKPKTIENEKIAKEAAEQAAEDAKRASVKPKKSELSDFMVTFPRIIDASHPLDGIEEYEPSSLKDRSNQRSAPSGQVNGSTKEAICISNKPSSNRPIDNLRVYYRAVPLPDRRLRGLNHFVRKDPLHKRATEFVNEHKMDLSNQSDISRLEELLISEFGKKKVWKNGRWPSENKPVGNHNSGAKQGSSADPLKASIGTPKKLLDSVLQKRTVRLFTRVVRHYNGKHPSGSRGWVTNLMVSDAAHKRADAVLRDVEAEHKLDSSERQNESKLVGFMTEYALKTPERKSEWNALLNNKK